MLIESATQREGLIFFSASSKRTHDGYSKPSTMVLTGKAIQVISLYFVKIARQRKVTIYKYNIDVVNDFQ